MRQRSSFREQFRRGNANYDLDCRAAQDSALLQSLAAAGTADAACTRTIAGAVPHRGIIAPARSWSRAAASIASTSAASRSTRPSRGPSSPPSSRQSSLPRSPLPSGSKRSRDLAQAMASRRRAGKLRSEPRRAPLSCRRSRQPAGRARPRARVGGEPERARSRQGRACTPRTGASTRALPRGARSSARARTRSRHRLARGNDHATRQEGAAAGTARGGHRQGRARQGRSPPHAALEGRCARRDRSGAAALAAGHDTHR